MAWPFGQDFESGFQETLRATRGADSRNGQAAAKGPHVMSKRDFTEGFVPPNYLIRGMLQRRFIYSLTGQTGHAKTAIALLLAELVSSPEPNAMLGRHRVRKGRVFYFVGENPDDVRMRVIAASHGRPGADKDQIFFIPGVFNISEMYALIAAEIAQRGGADLIIIDTSAAYFLGQDENANPQIGAHARGLRRLTELPGGPCVLVLCHPIKHVQEPAQLLPRGGGAFLAEMDGNLTAWKRDDLIELDYTKMRGPGFEPLAFKLERITSPDLVDVDGELIPTVRAAAITQSQEDEQADKSRADEDSLMAERLKVPDSDRVSIAQMATNLGWTLLDGAPAKSRVHRTLERLEKSKHMRRDRGTWVLTEKGKEAARKAALRMRTDQLRQDQVDMDFH